jgi:hypothetical protein
MEGVAVRAETSRAVLYRRWPNRLELAVTAIRHHTRLAVADIPDTGTLRGDVFALLRNVSARAGEGVGVVSFLIADAFNETGMSAAALRERRSPESRPPCRSCWTAQSPETAGLVPQLAPAPSAPVRLRLLGPVPGGLKPADAGTFAPTAAARRA